jgi:hypothetical protein
MRVCTLKLACVQKGESSALASAFQDETSAKTSAKTSALGVDDFRSDFRSTETEPSQAEQVAACGPEVLPQVLPLRALNSPDSPTAPKEQPSPLPLSPSPEGKGEGLASKNGKPPRTPSSAEQAKPTKQLYELQVDRRFLTAFGQVVAHFARELENDVRSVTQASVERARELKLQIPPDPEHFVRRIIGESNAGE